MKWVYILQCENNYYYVGQTSRLYRRFWEHQKGTGGLNTSVYVPKNIVAIYPVNRLGKFFEYITKVNNNMFELYFNFTFYFNDNESEYEHDGCDVENMIVEKMMMDNKEKWELIRGGKYVRFDVKYSFPNNKLVDDLPNCKCGFPCDVKLNEENKFLFFRCAKKNMWSEMRELFDLDEEPCNFFLKYTKDNEYKNKQLNIQSLISQSPWLGELYGGMYEFCVGGCGKRFDGYYTVRYRGKAINLCFDCFVHKNKELAEKYYDVMWDRMSAKYQ